MKTWVRISQNKICHLLFNADLSIQLSSQKEVFLPSLIETSILEIKGARQLKVPFQKKDYLLGMV